jgi:light-regulated signal transduction histidine kinase (bacteriophytochrome)
MALPLVSRGRVIGAMTLQSSRVAAFTEEDHTVLQPMTNLLANAIENARLYSAAQQEISERVRAEAALGKAAEELARSNAELEQFAYAASHDLQEPLRMVSSYMQLLARRYEGALDSDAHEFIGFAVDGAKRMQRLINDLLTYSRVGTRGKEFEPTDCEVILRQVLANLQVTISESAAVVTHDPLPTVLADDSQLVQLFQNLIGNAMKFRNERAPEIHIGAEPADDESYWRFFVRDNGIGIDDQYGERIFVIFQRLHTREEHPGTGIGLAICKKIVERHDGQIWVESQVGQGSTFCFTLPKLQSVNQGWSNERETR